MLQKYAAILVSFILMIAFLSLILIDDFKVPQREAVMSVSIKNQVNICVPQEELDE